MNPLDNKGNNNQIYKPDQGNFSSGNIGNTIHLPNSLPLLIFSILPTTRKQPVGETPSNTQLFFN